jgi:hypothetical protein
MKEGMVEPERGRPMAIFHAEQTRCCLGCGYSLRGLEEAICPECGRAFDPLNSATFIPTESCPRSVLGLLTPVRWPVRLAATLSILLVIASAIVGRFVAGVLALWLVVYLIVAVPCLVRSWFRWFAIRGFDLYPPLQRVDDPVFWRAKKWLAGSLIVSVLLYHALQILLLLILLIEFPWLSHKVHWLYDKEGMLANYPRDMWVGPVPVHVDYVIPWGVFLDVDGVKVAYVPMHPPPGMVREFFSHFAGDWYFSTDEEANVVP